MGGGGGVNRAFMVRIVCSGFENLLDIFLMVRYSVGAFCVRARVISQH